MGVVLGTRMPFGFRCRQISGQNESSREIYRMRYCVWFQAERVATSD